MVTMVDELELEQELELVKVTVDEVEEVVDEDDVVVEDDELLELLEPPPPPLQGSVDSISVAT